MVSFLWHIFRMKKGILLFQNATSKHELINIFKGRASSSSPPFSSPLPLNSQLLVNKKKLSLGNTSLPSQRSTTAGLCSCHAGEDVTVHYFFLYCRKHTFNHFPQSEPTVWKTGVIFTGASPTRDIVSCSGTGANMGPPPRHSLRKWEKMYPE